MDTTHGLDLAPLAVMRRAATATGTAEAAQMLAVAGVPVFPCSQSSTRPLTGRGPRAASADPDQVAWWWSRYPSANLAIPTGTTSGLDVVEVHPDRDARSGLDGIQRAIHTGLMPRPGLAVATPSGGLHLIFLRSPETTQRSWTAPGSGVEFHGDRGYVVLPPSLVQRPDGTVGRYQLIGSSNPLTGPVDAVALRRYLTPSSEELTAPVLGAAGPATRAAQVPVPAVASRPAAPGVRSLSRPDPGSPGRRPPEVVSL
ncbi:bifunctional DNA primase/polymerase [Promicromonospora sp. AC04]|uniref:bifunctional DNA primase/polymerase n=1 Tax=Promicromonospora sp. AC04 TaxID=2135723 RepID=UPI001304A8C0|nr:bifunctional DNA primase/polymerase [Promicromonospora sp. AC04]